MTRSLNKMMTTKGHRQDRCHNPRDRPLIEHRRERRTYAATVSKTWKRPQASGRLRILPRGTKFHMSFPQGPGPHASTPKTLRSTTSRRRRHNVSAKARTELPQYHRQRYKARLKPQGSGACLRSRLHPRYGDHPEYVSGPHRHWATKGNISHQVVEHRLSHQR